MKLLDLSVGLVREALQIYREVAFVDCEERVKIDLKGEADDSIEVSLSSFLDETPDQEGIARRYALRLGNARYPFMKFVVEEHLIRGEYFLAVDTHDQMFAATEDSAELNELRSFNSDLKSRIETAWREKNLPTVSHLKGLMETHLVNREEPRGQRLLVVDDDRDAAETLGMLLEARGFAVDCAANGEEALQLADPGRHDLIIMDVEMPVMDGLTACRRLKDKEETRGIPILLATAGALDLRTVHPADAFLVKPFQAEILFSFMNHLLGDGGKGGSDELGSGSS